MRNKLKIYACETCKHYCSIRDGDYICDKTGIPILVIEDYMPGEKYLWCGGRHHQRRDEKQWRI